MRVSFSASIEFAGESIPVTVEGTYYGGSGGGEDPSDFDILAVTADDDGRRIPLEEISERDLERLNEKGLEDGPGAVRDACEDWAERDAGRERD